MGDELAQQHGGVLRLSWDTGGRGRAVLRPGGHGEFLCCRMLLPRNSKGSASGGPRKHLVKQFIYNTLRLAPGVQKRLRVANKGGTLFQRASKQGAGSVSPQRDSSASRREAEERNPRWSTQLARAPHLCPAWASRMLLGPLAHQLYCTELAADPTTISPVVVGTPGRQPNSVQVPPVRVWSTTWIMFTVMPLDVTPSPVGICSLSVTKPTPGSATCVLGATSVGTDIPFTTRFANCEPSVLLVATPFLIALLAKAITASAVMRPFRRFTLSSVELLTAVASGVPLGSTSPAPLAMANAFCAPASPATSTLGASLLTTPPSAGSTATGAVPLAVGVLTATPNDCAVGVCAHAAADGSAALSKPSTTSPMALPAVVATLFIMRSSFFKAPLEPIVSERA